MVHSLSDRTQKWMTFLGGFLILLPNGISWYWGNVSIYVYSYFHHENHTDPHKVKAPWLLSLNVISWSTAILVSEYAQNKIGRRPTALLGVVFFNAGIVASYFVFKDSLALLDITMGVVAGFGSGMIHAVVLQTVIEWTVSHVGLATASMFTSYAIGSVVINQLITHNLNPHNKKVNVVIGETHYFSQPDILDKVPSVFLALSWSSGAFHIVGFLLLRLRQANNNNTTTSTTAIDDDDDESADNTKAGDERCHGAGDKKTCQSDLRKLSIPKKGFGNIQMDAELANDSMLEQDIKDTSMDSDHNLLKSNSNEKSPSQVLKTWFFYVLWFTMFGSDSAIMLLTNYYKIFGQVYIKDDHFLTNLGTILAVATIGMRLFWGFLTDVLGMKLTLVTLTSGLALISSGYYFTAPLNQWLFFVVTILFACFNCGIYVNFMVAIHSLYGKVHFTSNCGLITSSTIVLNLIFPPLSQFLLSHFGWFALFSTVGFVNLCCLVLIICSLPERSS